MKYKHPAPPIYSNSPRSIPAKHYVIIHNDYNETVNYTTIQTLLFTPQPLRAPGFCRTPSGRVGGRADKPR